MSEVRVGDALEELRAMADGSVDSAIFSPPYFALRRYHAGDREVGHEGTVDEYVTKLLTITHELQRVLADHGTLFINIGDTYSRTKRWGAPSKSLLLAPERLAVGLVEQGWLLRNVIVWQKTNGGLPTSVKDRFRNRHERVLFATKSPRYFFDLDRVRAPAKTPGDSKRRSIKPGKYSGRPAWAPDHQGGQDGLDRMHAAGRTGHPLGVNPGDVITAATAGFHGDHPAVYPAALIEPLILAGCPQRVCLNCNQPWQRQPRTDRLGDMRPTCGCGSRWRRGLVVDPFCGAGTTGIVAASQGRDFVGIELNPEYAALAEKRIASANARASPEAA